MARFDATILKPVCCLKDHTNDVTSVDFFGKTLLASGSSDKTIRIYKWLPDDEFEEVSYSPLHGHRYGINCVVFSPFGTKLASGSRDGVTIIWDIKTGKILSRLQLSGEDAGIRTCAFSTNCSLLATGGDDESLVIWDLTTLSPLREIRCSEGTITSISFTPDNCYLATGNSNGELHIWDGMYGHSLPLAFRQEVHDLGILTIHFNPNIGKEENVFVGKHYLLATGGQDNDLHLWVIQLGSQSQKYSKGSSGSAVIRLHHTLCGHKAPIMMVKFSCSGAILASASGDKTVRLWNALKMTPLGVFEGPQRYVTSCAFSNDGALLAAGGGDRITHIWKIDERALIKNNALVSSSGVQLRKFMTIFPGHRLRENKKVSEWTVDDVVDWLSEQDLAEYCHNFRAHAIDGREMLNMSHSVLESTLGVDALGHRNKIMRILKSLKRENSTSSLGSSNKTPSEFLCPITQELMLDPVLCGDGFTYERQAIEAWLANGKKTSPLTNEKLTHLLITPNRTLRNLIQRYKEENS